MNSELISFSPLDGSSEGELLQKTGKDGNGFMNDRSSVSDYFLI